MKSIQVALLASTAYGVVVKRDLTVQTTGSWQSLGCYSDIQSSRTLDQFGFIGSDVSGPACQNKCQSLGYVYAGTEFSGQCYCAQSINPIAVQKPDSDCNMACTADATQPCGGADRINLFWNGTTVDVPVVTPSKTLPTGWRSAGCYSDSVAARALPTYITGPGTGMTVEYCVRGCASAGYSYGALQFGDECYCGNEIQNGHGPTAAEDCNMACTGDSTEICGGRDRMSVYTVNPPVSSASPSSSSAAPAASSSAPAVPAPLIHQDTGLPAGWTYKGCNSYNYRYQQIYFTDPGTNTPTSCINLCDRAWNAAAPMGGDRCWCGGWFDASDSILLDPDQCNVACAGDSTLACGGKYSGWGGPMDTYSKV